MANPHGNIANLTLGRGRTPGVPNRYNASFRDALLRAFQANGGWKALAAWGAKAKNQTAFYQICARLVPTEVVGQLTSSQVIVMIGTGAQPLGPNPWDAVKTVTAERLEAPSDANHNGHYQTLPETGAIRSQEIDTTPQVTEPQALVVSIDRQDLGAALTAAIADTLRAQSEPDAE
jgi:hypothetical protein